MTTHAESIIQIYSVDWTDVYDARNEQVMNNVRNHNMPDKFGRYRQPIPARLDSMPAIWQVDRR